MQLKDFIKTVIVEIAEGINEANTALKSLDASVNPYGIQPRPEYGEDAFAVVNPIGEMEPKRLVHTIEFDVAVHASEQKEKKGGVGVLVASIGLGMQGKSDNSIASTSRIKFKIPMAFPKGKWVGNKTED